MEVRTLLASVAMTLPPVLNALLETIQLLWFADKVLYYIYLSEQYCNTYWYIIIIVCIEGDVRLVDQSFSSSHSEPLNMLFGTVQVCVNQQYVYICANNWDDREADVVCRSLNNGFKAPYYGIRSSFIF